MVKDFRRICADWSVEHAGDFMTSELVATGVTREGDMSLAPDADLTREAIPP